MLKDDSKPVMAAADLPILMPRGLASASAATPQSGYDVANDDPRKTP